MEGGQEPVMKGGVGEGGGDWGLAELCGKSERIREGGNSRIYGGIG